MRLAHARLAVAASGAVVAVAAGLGLWLVGGPEASRVEARDARRLLDLETIVAAIACHVEAGARPARPASLAEIGQGCLAPGRAATLVDPADGSAYRIEHPEPTVVRACAAFERPEPQPFAPPAFDPATGCLARALPAP